MTRSQARKLRPGDEVRWTDPDGDACTKVVTVAAIDWRGEVVRITDTRGGYLEAFARELS